MDAHLKPGAMVHVRTGSTYQIGKIAKVVDTFPDYLEPISKPRHAVKGSVYLIEWPGYAVNESEPFNWRESEELEPLQEGRPRRNASDGRGSRAASSLPPASEITRPTKRKRHADATRSAPSNPAARGSTNDGSDHDSDGDLARPPNASPHRRSGGRLNFFENPWPSSTSGPVNGGYASTSFGTAPVQPILHREDQPRWTGLEAWPQPGDWTALTFPLLEGYRHDNSDNDGAQGGQSHKEDDAELLDLDVSPLAHSVDELQSPPASACRAAWHSARVAAFLSHHAHAGSTDIGFRAVIAALWMLEQRAGQAMPFTTPTGGAGVDGDDGLAVLGNHGADEHGMGSGQAGQADSAGAAVTVQTSSSAIASTATAAVTSHVEYASVAFLLHRTPCTHAVWAQASGARQHDAPTLCARPACARITQQHSELVVALLVADVLVAWRRALATAGGASGSTAHMAEGGTHGSGRRPQEGAGPGASASAACVCDRIADDVAVRDDGIESGPRPRQCKGTLDVGPCFHVIRQYLRYRFAGDVAGGREAGAGPSSSAAAADYVGAAVASQPTPASPQRQAGETAYGLLTPMQGLIGPLEAAAMQPTPVSGHHAAGAGGAPAGPHGLQQSTAGDVTGRSADSSVVIIEERRPGTSNGGGPALASQSQDSSGLSFCPESDTSGHSSSVVAVDVSGLSTAGAGAGGSSTAVAQLQAGHAGHDNTVDISSFCTRETSQSSGVGATPAATSSAPPVLADRGRGVQARGHHHGEQDHDDIEDDDDDDIGYNKRQTKQDGAAAGGSTNGWITARVPRPQPVHVDSVSEASSSPHGVEHAAAAASSSAPPAQAKQPVKPMTGLRAWLSTARPSGPGVAGAHGGTGSTAAHAGGAQPGAAGLARSSIIIDSDDEGEDGMHDAGAGASSAAPNGTSAGRHSSHSLRQRDIVTQAYSKLQAHASTLMQALQLPHDELLAVGHDYSSTAVPVCPLGLQQAVACVDTAVAGAELTVFTTARDWWMLLKAQAGP